MSKVKAYFIKEFQTDFSYRLDFVLRVISSLFFVFVFFYLSRLIGGGSQALKAYNGDYFSYVLIGLAFHGFFTTALQSFSQTIRTEQMTGTLEHLLVTPTPPWIVLLGGILWRFVYDGIQFVVIFAVGITLLHAHYTAGGAPAAALALILTLVSNAALGLIAGGFIMLFKRGDPVATVFGFLTALLGGVYFPIGLLPEALRSISVVLPITYSVRIARDAFIQGASMSSMGHDFAALAILSVVLLPIGILFFGYAIRRAREDGSLGQY